MANPSFIAKFDAHVGNFPDGIGIQFVEIPTLSPNVVIRDEAKVQEIKDVIDSGKLLGVYSGSQYFAPYQKVVNGSGNSKVVLFYYSFPPSPINDASLTITVPFAANQVNIGRMVADKVQINDDETAETTTWSSNKIEDAINKTITETPIEEIGDMYITDAIKEGIRLGEVANERLDGLGETVHIIRFNNTGSAIVGPTPSEAAQAILDGCVPVMSFSEAEGTINRVSAAEYIANAGYVRMKFVAWEGTPNYSPILFIISSNGSEWEMNKIIFHIT